MTRTNDMPGREAEVRTVGPSADEVRAQLERILDSPPLKGSPRRRDLLRYLVEETLAGRGDQIKGYSVALAVFDRAESFDPSADPVVRLEAGRLRRALDTYYVDADSRDTVRITIPKGAYVANFSWRTVYAVTPADDAGTAGAPPPTDDQAGTAALEDTRESGNFTIRRFRGRAGAIAALAFVAFLGMAGLSWMWLRANVRDLPDPQGSAIIVLPFDRLDDGDHTKLLANAITQDLIHDLMRFPGFRLYSAQESFSRDPSTDPVALGRDLGVAYVLGGNVQSGPGRIRVDVHLVDATSGEFVWSGSYDRTPSPDDLLGMRGELSSAVATALGETYGVVNAASIGRLSATGAPSMESYFCVLQSYDYRRTFEDAHFEPALDCLQQAVVRDPDYADAWAMLGWLQLDAARQDMVPAAEHPARIVAAREAASHAIEVDPDNQLGLAALAAITFDAGDFALSERLQRQALALNPHNPETLAQLGWRLCVRGNWDEGISLLNKAIARSANPPGWYYHLISIHDYLKGDYQAALAAADRSARVGSAIGLSLAAISHAKLGDMDAARHDLDAMAEAWPLLASDPAAAYRRFQATDQIVAALVDALRQAGWEAP